jgi:hypothetical protein
MMCMFVSSAVGTMLREKLELFRQLPKSCVSSSLIHVIRTIEWIILSCCYALQFRPAESCVFSSPIRVIHTLEWIIVSCCYALQFRHAAMRGHSLVLYNFSG